MKPGHVGVVVGASSGIGRALASKLAARGANVIAVGRDRGRLDATLEELGRVGGSGRHQVLALDAAAPDDMEALAGICARDYGRVDLLVASAAVPGYDGLPPATQDLPLGAWQKAIEVNLHGVFLSNRAVLPMMLSQGDGDILNICSSTTPHGLRGVARGPAYAATKFAVAEFTRVLATEVAERGIRVNAIFPGAVKTPLIASTAVEAPYGGSIEVGHFAEAVIDLLEFSRGAFPPDPFILPLPTRKPPLAEIKETPA